MEEAWRNMEWKEGPSIEERTTTIKNTGFLYFLFILFYYIFSVYFKQHPACTDALDGFRREGF